MWSRFCQPYTMSLSVISHPSLGHQAQPLKTPWTTLVALVVIMCPAWKSHVHSFLSNPSPHCLAGTSPYCQPSLLADCPSSPSPTDSPCSRSHSPTKAFSTLIPHLPLSQASLLSPNGPADPCLCSLPTPLVTATRVPPLSLGFMELFTCSPNLPRMFQCLMYPLSYDVLGHYLAPNSRSPLGHSFPGIFSGLAKPCLIWG